MEHLSKLFGSPARVKLLRFFLFNPDTPADRDTVVSSARISPDTASKELSALARAGIVARKTYYRDVVRPGTHTPKKRKTLGYVLDAKYPHLEQLTKFMRDTISISETDIRGRLRNVGTIKLIVLAGFLINQDKSALDLLIVGDKIDETALRNVVRGLEAECGKEIRYAVLPTEDYQYRRRVRDRLVREVMDFEHKEILNRLSTV